MGNPNLLSQLIKKVVINNFRQNDIRHGGEGAPLAPIFHKLIVKQTNVNEVYQILGPPSTKSTFDNDVYIYIERKTSSSKLVKMGNVKAANKIIKPTIP